jgi:site-specific recombinase XerD
LPQGEGNVAGAVERVFHENVNERPTAAVAPVGGRHYVDESLVQKAVRTAVMRAGLTKCATCHTFRRSFAAQLPEGGYNIRTVQELLGYKDVNATMICTHVLNRGDRAVKSPADNL